jgi:fused signal recognition particle receptor
MFRRMFGGDRPDEREEQEVPAEEMPPATQVATDESEDDLLTQLLAEQPSEDGSTASTQPDTGVMSSEISAPETTAEPETPRYAPLFRNTDEVERSMQSTIAAPQPQGGMLRRLFGGEERTDAEIQREERKTEQAVLKTRGGFFGRINEKMRSDDPLTDDLWEELEELMIQADVGVDTTLDVIERVRRRAERENLRYAKDARAYLKQEMIKLLEPNTRAYAKRGTKPWIVLVVGVNGAGKTTLIAKLANRYKNEIGQNVLVAAADTFRAAAVEQLRTWAERIDVPVIAQGQGADPGAVAYDAVDAALARNTDVVIIDTAGRLQAKFNLMQELQKVSNVVRKRVEEAPHEVLLVVDATTGQNGISQAKAFMASSDVTHLALTKLDGTAKGGIAFAMVQQIQRPIRYIGTGEKVDDLALFDARAFVDALFDEPST